MTLKSHVVELIYVLLLRRTFDSLKILSSSVFNMIINLLKIQ